MARTDSLSHAPARLVTASACAVGVLLCAAALVAAPAARACGVCDEDKVAATYDHAVVERAGAGGRVVVFCAVQGGVDARRLIRLHDAASAR